MPTPSLRRPFARFFACAAALTGLVTATSDANAQQQAPAQPIPVTNGYGYDLHLFRPAVDSKGQFSVNGTDILGAGDFSFGFVGDIGIGMLHNDQATGNPALVGTGFTGTLQANIGIGNVIALGLQVPIQVFSGDGRQQPTMMNPNNDSANFRGISRSLYNPNERGLAYQGLGDITVHAKLRWLRAEYFPVGLAILVQAGINPMGGSFGSMAGNGSTLNGRSFAGEPMGYVWPSAALEWRPNRRIRVDFNAGFRLPFATFQGSGTRFSDMTGAAAYGPSITWGIGASFRAATVLDLVAEAYGLVNTGGFSDIGHATPVEAVIGAKIFVQRNSYLMLGGGTGIFTNHSPSAADFRAFVGIVFEPSIGDADGDGYRDDVDSCINDPEDYDGFQDEDGCSDPDNDRDGLLDADDQCPNVPEDRDGDQDSDGCPEGQESDRDGDGILDNADHCADDPEDRDGFQDEDGCPDPDNDNDQIPDTLDNCPNEPEDRDEFNDDDGCPDPDNDEDHILDVNDRCPNQPEVLNGVDDDDGCPDSGDLQILGNVINLRQQIQFETDSAEIRAVSAPILEQMAELLRRNSQFELVEVEGHTDVRAPDDHNLRLSNDRANAVMQALVQRGIAPGRLVAAGYGEYCPLDPANNARAWERNRRVQFIIVRTHDEGRTTAAAGCRRAAQYIPPTVGPPGSGVAREASGGAGGSSASPAPSRSPAP